MIDRRRILVLAVALAVTGGVSIAAEPDPEPPENGRSGEQQQPIEEVDADHAAHYAVLRRPVTSEDRLRDEAVRFVTAMMTADNGASPGLARRAQVTASNAAVYVIPARGFVCLYVTAVGTDEGSSTCNRTDQALRSRVVGVEWPRPGVTRITGLATDDVAEVRLRVRDGEVERVTPVANTYVFETAADPVQVEWGDEVLPIPAGLKD